MKTCSEPTQKEINEVLEALKEDKFSRSNQYFQFFKASTGELFKYDFTQGKYTSFSDNVKFAKAVVRFFKRGW